jgi:WD40 repeat protein
MKHHAKIPHEWKKGYWKKWGACAWSPDGATVLSASGDSTLKLWDTINTSGSGNITIPSIAAL